MGTYYNSWMIVSIVLSIIIGCILYTADGLSTTNDRESRKLFGGYKITPKFCNASKSLPADDPRLHGPTICMFNHECTQRHGEVVGACMDGFLFGTCCQLHGSVETPLNAEMQTLSSSRPAAAISYESYGNHQSPSFGSNINIVKERPSSIFHQSTTKAPTPVSTSGSYYAAVVNLDNEINLPGDQDNNLQNDISLSDSIKHSTPEYNDDYNLNRVSYYPIKSTTAGPPTQHEMYLPPSVDATQTFSPELPTLLNNYGGHEDQVGSFSTPHPTHDFTSAGIHHITQTLLNDNSGVYSQNKITNPNTISVELNGEYLGNYGPTSPSSHLPTSEKSIDDETTTPRIIKTTHKKPQFKPKPTSYPTSDSTNKYVLVHTISNEKEAVSNKPDATISSNNYDSIQSIILMLNGSQSGPEYDTHVDKSDTQSTIYYGSATPSYGTTGSQNNYGSTNFYVTTKLPTTDLPKRPSTSYIFSTTTPARKPSKPVKSSTPSTFNDDSYTLISSTVSTVKIPSSSLQPPSSTKRPAIIISSSTYGGVSKPITKKPSHEVIITPTTQKPTRKTNTKRPSQTKLSTSKAPSTSYITASTARPKPPPKSTHNPPSTSYISSTDAPIRRPISKPTKAGFRPSSYSTTENPEYDDLQSPQSGYVQISTISERPHPTVHITPKPSGGTLQTTSTWTNGGPLPQYTISGQPGISTLIFNPVSVSSLPGHYSTTPAYPPLSNDFDDSGYFGVTIRPSLEQHTVTSTAIYNVVPQDILLNSYGHPAISSTYPITGSTYGETAPTTPQTVINDKLKDDFQASDSVNNFPPVRNPNLNTTIQDHSVTPVTPQFQEDEVLKDKMSLLVNRIVESLQGNFDSLADMVYDRNETYVDIQELEPTKKPTTTTSLATSTKRPPGTKRPTVQADTTITSATRPSSSKPVTTKKPKPRVTTPKTTVPSKKPSTRKPTTIITTTTQAPITTRKPSKATRRPTTKPTRRVTTTTIATTIPADEYVDSEEDGEYIEQENATDEDSTGPPNGKWQCGVRPQVKSGRIVGGKSSAFGEWPWQVLVRESTWLGLFTKNKCGGVLISNSFVMTAAHCQPGFLASLVAVFGEYDISGELETKRSVTKNVKSIVVHRQYDAATFENDLALLELESPIHYDSHIVPICMPRDDTEFTGRMATVTGWGRLKYGGGVPSVLQQVKVPIIENSVCQEMFNTAGHNKKILPSFLCAGYANGQKDSCEGDSGGPLVIQRTDGRWELAGTVSHGIKCASPYLPGVYMRTTFYKPWLKQVTGIN